MPAAGQPVVQCGGLLIHARFPQLGQCGHAIRVVEGSVGGRVAGQQRGGLLVRARLSQAVQREFGDLQGLIRSAATFATQKASRRTWQKSQVERQQDLLGCPAHGR